MELHLPFRMGTEVERMELHLPFRMKQAGRMRRHLLDSTQVRWGLMRERERNYLYLVRDDGETHHHIPQAPRPL